MGTVDVEQNLQTSTATLGGENLVFHCHFYNCALQAAIEDALGADAVDVQRSAAHGVVRAQLAALGEGQPPEARLALGAQVFSQLGFGTLDLSGVGPRGGRVVVRASHYAMGWVAIYGERSTPACNFVEGFVGAAVGAAFGLSAERVRAREVKCFACGAETCELDVEVL
jgi:hypothetical protein